jgi:hypothetical protein
VPTLDEISGGSLKEELAAMPAMHRAVVYIAFVFMVCLLIESIFILPTILIKWGWGYTVGG